MNSTDGSSQPVTLISALVPMLHVAHMERSLTFYRLLGFEVGNYVPRSGPMQWAWLFAPKAADWKRGPNLMLTRGEDVIDAHVQGVLFYLYAADLEGLRAELIASGVAASEIDYPEYLPQGVPRRGP
jgi:catechol 2,3-dioxygenase-like lactoylglutathione lyase family enzyme